jgi:hypothetical protein
MRSYLVSSAVLLLQVYVELERISALPGASREAFDDALETAVYADFAVAVGLLVDTGANINKYTRRCQQEAREPLCYAVDPMNTKTSILAHAILCGCSATAEILLDKVAEVNLPRNSV